MCRDIDPEVLQLLAAVRPSDFQQELVGAAKFGCSMIERDKGWNLGRKALLDIGRLQRAALDVNKAVRRRGGEPDCGQRSRGAILLDVGIDANAGITARRRLDLAFNDAPLRVRRERTEAQ